MTSVVTKMLEHIWLQLQLNPTVDFCCLWIICTRLEEFHLIIFFDFEVNLFLFGILNWTLDSKIDQIIPSQFWIGTVRSHFQSF